MILFGLSGVNPNIVGFTTKGKQNIPRQRLLAEIYTFFSFARQAII